MENVASNMDEQIRLIREQIDAQEPSSSTVERIHILFNRFIRGKDSSFVAETCPGLPSDVCGFLRRRWLLADNNERYEIALAVEALMHYFTSFEAADAAGLVSVILLIAAFGTEKHKDPLWIASFPSAFTSDGLRIQIARILAPMETTRGLVLTAMKAINRIEARPWLFEFLPIFEVRLGTEFFERVVIDVLVLFSDDPRANVLKQFQIIVKDPKTSVGKAFLEGLQAGLNGQEARKPIAESPEWRDFPNAP
jgi:hypothetical protein